MEPKTKILSAKIHSLRFWVLEIEPEILKAQFQNYLEKVGFGIFNFTDYHFPVQGYTAFWLLAESHLAIHTFPNTGWSYIELSSCNMRKSKDFESLVTASDMSIKWNCEGVEVCVPE